MAVRDALAKSDVFQGLSDAHLALIEPLCKPATFEEGALVLEEDGRGGACFILVAGRVDIEIRPPFETKAPQRIATLKPGSLFGEVSLLDGFLRSANARASERSEVLAIDDKGLRALLEREPAIGFRVMKNLARILAERLRDMNMRLRNTLSEMLYY